MCFDPAEAGDQGWTPRGSFIYESPIAPINGNVQNWTDNRHGIVGYLDDMQVAKMVSSGF